jgi:hypothetical protein
VLILTPKDRILSMWHAGVNLGSFIAPIAWKGILMRQECKQSHWNDKMKEVILQWREIDFIIYDRGRQNRGSGFPTVRLKAALTNSRH